MNKPLILLSLFITSVALATCDETQISYQRSTGISLSIGGHQSYSSFSTSMTVNIPVMMDGRWACYKQSGHLGFQSETKKGKNKTIVSMTPPKVEFDGVKNARVVQYLDVVGDSFENFKLYALTSVCSGEIPLGQESVSESLIGVMMKGPASVEVSNVFATGIAAQNLKGSQTERYYSASALGHFASLYEKTNGDLPIAQSTSNIFIPSVLTGVSVNMVSREQFELYSSFQSRNQGKLNGCSEDFRQSMKGVLLENTLNSLAARGISAKIKKGSIEFTFKL